MTEGRASSGWREIILLGPHIRKLVWSNFSGVSGVFREQDSKGQN
jgi:hypothetical protein